jgi:hypothetical protein
MEIVEQHSKRPSALRYMTRAFLPSTGLRSGREFPSIVERWRGLRIAPDHVARFRAATGLDGASVLYPHVLGFRLQMATLTHPAFPLPIWNALQIRNHLVRHRRLAIDAVVDLETRVGAHRFLEKGMEVDLVTRLTCGGRCDWESVITYFYRGRFDRPTAETMETAAPDLSMAPVVARFHMPKGGGGSFGALTGDYNGIHWSRFYARQLGFRAAFLHPQRTAGQCLGRLAEPRAEAQTLDLWIKGPVFYGAEVTLSAIQTADETRFGLSLAGDDRAAIAGIWRNASAAPGA